jgi:excisionase family DNA binding protein
MATTPSYTAPQKLYTINEAAEYLRVSRRQIYVWLAKGLLDANQLPSGLKRITGESIARMLAPVK